MKNRRELIIVCTVLTVLTLLSGLGYTLIVKQDLNPLIINTYIAVFYMPTPLYTLLLASLILRQNLFKSLVDLKVVTIRSLGFTAMLFLAWLVITVALTLVLSQVASDQVAPFISSTSGLQENIESTLETTIPDDEVPPVSVFVVATIVGTITAGMTINAIFALTEEILWRGYLFTRLKNLNRSIITLIIGIVWGLWHAPLIWQGYNYGQSGSIIAVMFFVVFCIAFSDVFDKLVKITQSVLMAAILHGMFNAYAASFILLLNTPNLYIDGPVGLLSIISLILLAIILRTNEKRFTTLLQTEDVSTAS